MNLSNVNFKREENTLLWRRESLRVRWRGPKYWLPSPSYAATVKYSVPCFNTFLGYYCMNKICCQRASEAAYEPDKG